MTADLGQQLRALVGVARPVTAEEALARSRTLSSTFEDGLVPRPRRHTRTVVATAAAVALLAGGVGGAVASRSSDRPEVPAAAASGPPRGAVLTAAQIGKIVRSSRSLATAGGTAQITEWSQENGVPSGGYEAAVTFSGPNIDERVTSVPEPPGSAEAGAVDYRYVDGQFYTYTAGRGGVPEWSHPPTGSRGLLSMTFPTPSALDNVLSAPARFQYEGKSSVDGASLARLTALDPFAINAKMVGTLVDIGHITSCTVWVSSDGVIQEIALTVAAEIPFAAASMMGNLGQLSTVTTTSTVTVVFSQLGIPQNVVAPNVEHVSQGSTR